MAAKNGLHLGKMLYHNPAHCLTSYHKASLKIWFFIIYKFGYWNLNTFSLIPVRFPDLFFFQETFDENKSPESTLLE